jgi:hypothetical protein
MFQQTFPNDPLAELVNYGTDFLNYLKQTAEPFWTEKSSLFYLQMNVSPFIKVAPHFVKLFFVHE